MKPLLFGMALLASTAHAGTKMFTSMVVNPTCPAGCPVDTLKGTFKMQSTNASGANGVTFKVVVSGASLAGVPANIPNVLIAANLSVDLGACDAYTFNASIVEGRMRASFTGADVSPPIPEGAGSIYPCELIYLYDGVRIFALDAVVPGSDAD